MSSPEAPPGAPGPGRITLPDRAPFTRLGTHPGLVRFGAATAIFLLAFGVPLRSIVAHPESRMLGVGDGTGTLRQYWAASEQHRTPVTLRHDALIGAPEGTTVVPADIVANGGVQTAIIWALRGPLGLVGAYNLFMFLGLVGTALAMYAFLARLGCTFVASVLGGYILGFSPYAFERVYVGHLSLLQNWIFVGIAAAMLRVKETHSWRYVAGAGVMLALAFYLSAYQALLGSVIVLAFSVVEILRAPGRRGRLAALGRGAAVYAVSLAALLPVLVLYVLERSAVTSSLNRNADSLDNFGASLRAYFVPSLRNPLVPWLRRFHPLNVTEQTLFFGYATWILALAAAVLVVRRNGWLKASERRWHAALCLLALVPAAFLMSAPPHERLLGVSVPTPPTVVESLTTYWRAYSRFGIVVGFAVSALAALALSALSRRPGRGWRLLAPLAAAVIVVELIPGSITPFDATAVPGWVAWLRSHPGGIVATYPWVTNGDVFFEDTWYQVFDGHPRFVSGDPTGRLGAIRFLTRDVWRPLTPHVLAAEGVKYVVVNDDRRSRPPATDPADFTLVDRDGDVGIYEVHASKANLGSTLRENAGLLASLQGLAPSLAYGAGFNPPEQYENATGRWMIQDGQLNLQAGSATRFSIAGIAFSNGSSRTLELEDAAGRVLARTTITGDPTEMSLGPVSIPPGASTLMLVASPGAFPFGNGDTRKASVFLGPLTVNAIPTYLDHPPAPGP